MNFASTLSSFGQCLIYVVVCIAFIWVAKVIDDWRTKDFDDDAQIDDGNKAVGLRRSGLYLAIAIALSGTLGGDSRGFGADVGMLLLDGLIIIACLFSCRLINDKVMMGHINNDEECLKTFTLPDNTQETGNSALGMVEACMFIATGFILKGSLTGGGGTLAQNIESTFLFFILGQICLLGFGLLYEIITPFNVREEIKSNNLAAGIGLGGILIAFSIILHSSIAGPFTGWENDITSFLFYGFFGIVMLLIFRIVIDRIFLPTTNLATEIEEDQNTAALVVAQSALNAVAIIIAFSM